VNHTPLEQPIQHAVLGPAGVRSSSFGPVENVSSSLDLIRRFSKPKATSTPQLLRPIIQGSCLITVSEGSALDLGDWHPCRMLQPVEPLPSVVGADGFRLGDILSSISSPGSGSPSHPVFFSRDAQKKKKRGRPRKKTKGR